MNDIVITGAGLVTPLGLDREQTWQAVLAGRCGVRTLTALEQPPPSDKGGGQAPDLPEDFAVGLPREVRYLRWVLRAALSDAGGSEALPYEPHRCGFMLGTTLHGIRGAGEYLRTGNYEPLERFLGGATLKLAAEGLAIAGPAATTCSACSSSLGSIALAVTLLKTGQLDLVIAGGYDTISEYAYAGFNSLRLVAEGPLRPFACDREGMKLAEGYGIVVLERAEDAGRRGARVLAEILGWGESADAHHLTQPHPEGDGAARAIAGAIRSAKLTPADIDLIAAHATGTPDNDAGEFAALRRVFGGDLPRVPVVGFKSHLGHTLGGAGACELILSALALRDQVVPACANAKPNQSEFEGLRLSTSTAHTKIRATLNTSLGFGGANTCIILGPAQKANSGFVSHRDTAHPVFITGIGVLLPGVSSLEALGFLIHRDHPPAWSRDTGAIDESNYIHLLNARRVRRMSQYVKLTLAATALALADAGISDVTGFAERCSVVLGTTHGSTNYSATYYRQIVTEGIAAANPMLFAEGVPNAAAAHLSLMLGLKGACQTIIGTRTSGLDALRLAGARIASGEWDRAIVGAAEEYDSIVNASYKHCRVYSGDDGTPPFGEGRGFVTGSAAVTFVLESQKSLEQRKGRPIARFICGSSARSTSGPPVEALQRVTAEFGKLGQIICSANGTWIDRAELAALEKRNIPTTVSTVYGHVAESFSAGPLVAIAAALAARKLPAVLEPASSDTKNVRLVRGDEPINSPFGVLCTDYSGVASGAAIAPMDR